MPRRGAALLVLVALLTWGGREAFSRFKADELVKSSGQGEAQTRWSNRWPTCSPTCPGPD